MRRYNIKLTIRQKQVFDGIIKWAERAIIALCVATFIAFGCHLFGCHLHVHMGEKHFHDTQKTNTQEGIVLSFPDEEEQ